MLKNFYITAFRNLLRNRTYAFINIFGLALGISAALVLFKFINYHKSFDKFHSNYDELYRFNRIETSANNVDRDRGVPLPFAGAFANDYPDLGKVTIVQYAEELLFKVTGERGEERKFLKDEGIAFVQENFFEFFDVEVLAGNKETLFQSPDEVALSVSQVATYFGYGPNELDRALGKIVRLANKRDLRVTGVVPDAAQNSDMKFGTLVSFMVAEDIFPLFDFESWGSVSSNTNAFLLKPEAVTEEAIGVALDEIVAKYQPEEIETEAYVLQPFDDIHFNAEVGIQFGNTVSRQILWGCAVTGIILIITACINFINLSTAQAVKRAKEVGVRKVLGGSKRQLVSQFLSETLMITLLSVIISLGIAELALNNLDILLGYELTLDLLNDPTMLLYLGIIMLGVTLLAGWYPSAILSTLNPVAAMKRRLSQQVSGRFNLRRGLVVTQFFISQFLIICTLVVLSQMNHFYNKDMGFAKESIISFQMGEPGTRYQEQLRSRLEGNPNIENLSFHVGAPLSRNNLGSNFNYEPLANDTDFDAHFKLIDEYYLDLFDIPLLAGRNLRKGDTLLQNALVTETVLKMIGITDPQEIIGKKIQTSFNGDKTIVGVVKDFHSYSLKSELQPLFLISYANLNFEGAVKVIGGEEAFKQTVAAIEKEWNEVFPEYIFEYNILEERIDENYNDEANMLTLFQIFSGITIFIGCLGLYGLIAFMANQKKKEIGVRKVLGATVNQILSIFSKELILLIAAGFVVAAPLGYYTMDQWLLDFEYSIDMKVWMFGAAILFTVVVGSLTAGLRSLQAARANPVDSLRSE